MATGQLGGDLRALPLQRRGVEERHPLPQMVVHTVVGADADEGAQQRRPGHAEDESHGRAVAEPGEVGWDQIQLLDERGDV
jgi:hypothetical protein